MKLKVYDFKLIEFKQTFQFKLLTVGYINNLNVNATELKIFTR